MTAQIQVPVVEGLMTLDANQPVLLGSACTGCGTHFFPRARLCRNPSCADPDAKRVDVRLGTRGRLHSITLQNYQPPPPFRMEPWQNHVVGLVELPERVRVLGLMVDVDYPNIKLDVPVELTTIALYRDEQQRDVVTYAFRAVTDEQAGVTA